MQFANALQYLVLSEPCTYPVKRNHFAPLPQDNGAWLSVEAREALLLLTWKRGARLMISALPLMPSPIIELPKADGRLF